MSLKAADEAPEGFGGGGEGEAEQEPIEAPADTLLHDSMKLGGGLLLGPASEQHRKSIFKPSVLPSVLPAGLAQVGSCSSGRNTHEVEMLEARGPAQVSYQPGRFFGS